MFLGAQLCPPEVLRTLPTLVIPDRFSPGLEGPIGTCGEADDWCGGHNDTVGTCVLTAIANAVRCWSDGATVIEDDWIVGLYRTATGYDGTPASDHGTRIPPLLERWRGGGILLASGEPDLLMGWRLTDVSNLKAAIALGKCALVVCDMPKDVVTQDPQATWTVGFGPDAAPGSLGPHCMLAIAMDGLNVTLVTWKREQTVTLSWMIKYTREVYALAHADWVPESGYTLAQIIEAEEKLK